MITFEELGKLTTAREAELEKAKKESLEENQKAEIEARIDRAIKMTRLSNSETTQITIHFGNDYSGYLLNQVMEKYQAEGYFATLETIGFDFSKEELAQQLELMKTKDADTLNKILAKKQTQIKYDLIINWDPLIHKQIADSVELNEEFKKAYHIANIGGENHNDYKETDIITDEDDKASLNNYDWLDEFQFESWDRAIYFADKCFRGTDKEKKEMLDSVGIVVIENIISAFIHKIFGKENSNIAFLLSSLIERELELIDIGLPLNKKTIKEEINQKDTTKIIYPEAVVDITLDKLKELNAKTTEQKIKNKLYFYKPCCSICNKPISNIEDAKVDYIKPLELKGKRHITNARLICNKHK